MTRRIHPLIALALVACEQGISEDTADTFVDIDTTDVDTEWDTSSDIDTDFDSEADTDPDTNAAFGDVNEVNDSMEQATLVTIPHEQVGLSIHAPEFEGDEEDEDYFRIDLNERAGLRLSISFSHADGDLDMRLLDGNGNNLQTSQGTTNSETMQPTLDAGTYYLRVYGYNGAVNSYSIEAEVFEAEDIDVSDVFSDLTVAELDNPQVFGSGLGQTFALTSDIYNIGTAPAPGSSLGQGTGMFRLRELDGTIVAQGTKGPIFFTNNGGCPGTDIHAEWVARGEPHIPGSEGNNSLTDPGCADYYGASTNNNLDTPLVIGDPSVVPDGDYYYELEVDAANTYVWEASFARGNNSSWRPIRIGTLASGQRTVRTVGPLIRGGVVDVDAGTIDTILGSGDTGGSVSTGTSALGADIGRVWGVARDPEGLLIASLPDAGSVVRVDTAGNIQVLASGLTDVRGIDVNADGDLLVVDAGTNAVLELSYSAGTYSTPIAFAVNAIALNEPSSAVYGPGGTVWIANTGAHQVLSVDPITHTATVAAGNGLPGLDGDGDAASSAKLYRPLGIDVRDDGMLAIADGHSNRIRIANTHTSDTLVLGGVSVAPGQIETLAGVGDIAALDADPMDNEVTGYNGHLRHARAIVLDWPSAVQIVGDRVFVVDSDNQRLRSFDEHGTAHDLAGSFAVPLTSPRSPGTSASAVGDGLPAADADLNQPLGLWVSSTEDGYRIDVADAGNHRVRTLDTVTFTPGPSLED